MQSTFLTISSVWYYLDALQHLSSFADMDFLNGPNLSGRPCGYIFVDMDSFIIYFSPTWFKKVTESFPNRFDLPFLVCPIQYKHFLIKNIYSYYYHRTSSWWKGFIFCMVLFVVIGDIVGHNSFFFSKQKGKIAFFCLYSS